MKPRNPPRAMAVVRRESIEEKAAPRGFAAPPALLFVLLFGCYAATACRTVGPGDSGELTAAMASWGVAHAPGYPLFTLIGNLVTRLPHPGEPAFALNLLCAAFSALACALLGAAVGALTRSPWVGFAAGLALGTSRVFWQYALVVEVFGLNALMAALLLYFLARFLAASERGRSALWTLPASALVMSCVLTHHTTLILIALPVLVTWAILFFGPRGRAIEPARLRQALGFSLAAGLAGLLPLAYLPLAARFDPPLNWGDPENLRGLVALLARQDFGSGWLMAPDIVVARVLEEGEAASPLGLRHFRLFWSGLPAAFGWAFPALAALGLLWAARRRRILLLMVTLFLGALLAFFSRVNTPVLPLYLGITERFHILPHVVLAFFAGLGVAQLEEWARRAHPRGPWVARAAAIAATGMAMLALHWGTVDMSRNTFTRDFGANLLAGTPPRALLFSSGDLFANSVAYQQNALGRRRDVALVDQPMMNSRWYLEQLRRRGVLRVPDSTIAHPGGPVAKSRAWLDLNLGRSGGAARPVLAVRLADESWRRAYRLLPMGLSSEVVPRGKARDPAEWARAFGEIVRQWEPRSIEARYPETSWEGSEQVFYTWALANLQALRDLTAKFRPEDVLAPSPPALALAARWTGGRRADFLAWQAEFWRSAAAESLIALTPPAESLLVDRAMALARATLALDPGNVQALQSSAELLSAVPRFRDPRAELAFRFRIVRRRPGDVAELTRCLELAGRVMRESGALDAGVLAEAEAARLRYVRLLEICQALWKQPQLGRLREQWSRSPRPAPP